ncbi:MAG: tRNA (adenosine(37)-N6)-threonylcarbamoyltransferase complex ATPase subunit type 1 TsaE [Eubacteriales bacterium]|nr:tRNA (adenosine(37)-N6)-threonylcarbamoyltransferase complex ATPase subunit type 1 TsaE [Eubacteriales bacterium]
MTITTHSPEETQELAARLGKALFPGAVLALRGDLGAGKTAFVRGLAQGMGVSGRVHSPTFALVHEHNGPLPLFHFDLYRLEDGLAETGLDEYFDRGGVCALEWPEKAEDELPLERLDVILRSPDEATREITFLPRGKAYEECIKSLL